MRSIVVASPDLLDDDLVVAVALVDADQPVAGLRDPLRDVRPGARCRVD